MVCRRWCLLCSFPSPPIVHHLLMDIFSLLLLFASWFFPHSFVRSLFQGLSMHPSQKSHIKFDSIQKENTWYYLYGDVENKFQNKNINVSVKYTETKNTLFRKHNGTFIKTNTITLTYLCDLLHQFPVTIRIYIRPFLSIHSHTDVFLLYFFLSPFCGWAFRRQPKYNMHAAD